MIIDGKAIAARKLQNLKAEVEKLQTKPKLGVIVVGGNPASKIYVGIKVKRAAEIGIESVVVNLAEESDTKKVIEAIELFNKDSAVTGILVQLPLPEEIRKNTEVILASIEPEKDVDGLGAKSKFLPATVKAILTILEENQVQIEGANVASVGQGKLVGKPLSMELERLGAKVTRCDEFTDKGELVKSCRSADIIVSATGVAGLIIAEMVKKGAVVIDCGAPSAEVDFEKVKEIASMITPVPGGVGPVTVASLLENLVEAGRILGITHT